MKFLRASTDEYAMFIKIEKGEEADTDECEEIGTDEWLARKKIIEAWNEYKQNGSIYSIVLFRNYEVADIYYGDGNWEGGRRPCIVDDYVVVDDWDQKLSHHRKRKTRR